MSHTSVMSQIRFAWRWRRDGSGREPEGIFIENNKFSTRTRRRGRSERKRNYARKRVIKVENQNRRS